MSQGSSSFKYHAFISYNYQDKLWGEWLHKELETYRIPKGVDEHVTLYAKDEIPRRLFPVFRDRDELSSAGKINETVMKALGESRAMIVICSPNSAKSEWVQAEVSTFQKQYPERPILALVVENDPPDCFPPALLDEQPLAADARMEGDGKPDAILKLIGGLLGVGFGILKDREAKRKRQRMVTLVSVISSVALGFAGLTLWAMKAEQETKKALVAEEYAKQGEMTQRKAAEQSAAESKAVMKFFQDKVMSAARPKGLAGGLGINATIREALNAAEPQIGEAFADQPLVEAAIRHSLGLTYNFLGEPNAELRQREQTLELRENVLGKDHPDTLSAVSGLANYYRAVGRLEEALPLHEQTLALRKKVLGLEHKETIQSMWFVAMVYRQMGRHEEALALAEEVLILGQKVLGRENGPMISYMENLAYTYLGLGRRKEAAAMFGKTVELKKHLYGPEHPAVLMALSSLNSIDRNIDRLKETIALQKKVLGTGHPDTLVSMLNLSYSYRAEGRYQEMLDLSKIILPLAEKALGAEHPHTLGARMSLGGAYAALGRHEEALPLLEESLGERIKVLGPEHPQTIKNMLGLAYTYSDLGRFEEAQTLAEEALNLRKKLFGPSHPNTLSAMSSLADFYGRGKRREDAERLYRQYIAEREKQSVKDLIFFKAQTNLGIVLIGLKKYDEAEVMLLAGYEGLKTEGPSPSKTERDRAKFPIGQLGILYKMWGKPEKAAEWKAKLEALENSTATKDSNK